MENQIKDANLVTDYFNAVKSNDIDAVIELIEKGVDINSLNENKNNALFMAAAKRANEMFEWLLLITQKNKKINLDNQNIFGETLVFECIKQSNMTFYLEKLIEHGANVNLCSNEDMSPLIKACADKKNEELEILIKAKGLDINYKIPNSNISAFLMAANQSNKTAIDILSKANADINVLDSQGKNALLNTLFTPKSFMKKNEIKEHTDLCVFLINSGIDLNYIAPSGLTAFWAVSNMRDKNLTKLLLEKNVDVNVTHEIGLNGKQSALHLWCCTPESSIVEEMLKKGAKLGFLDEKGNLPESYGFFIPKLQQLMLDYGADVNAKLYQKEGKNNLVIPVLNGVINVGDKALDILNEMIKRNVNLVYNESYLQPFDPLFCAVSVNAPKMVNALVATNKIELNRHIKMSKDSEEISLLSFVVSGINQKNFSAQLQQKKALQTILDKNELLQKNEKKSKDNNLTEKDITEKDTLSKIEMMLGQLTNEEKELNDNKKEIFNTLLKNGAKIDFVNSKGHTEIFFAENELYASWLKDAGANIFHIDNEGRDVLLYSVINNSNSILYWKEEFKNKPIVENILYQIAFENFTENPYKNQLIKEGVIKYLNNPDIALILNDEIKDEDKPVISIKELLYQDEDGNTPLLVACANNANSLVSLYIKLGADVNCANKLGETPLMHALNTEDKNLIEFLIENNANINAQNLAGKTIMDMVEELDKKSITHLFNKVVENNTKKKSLTI